MILTKVQTQNNNIEPKQSSCLNIGTDYKFKRKIAWKNVSVFIILHLYALFGLYLIPSASVLTAIFAFFRANLGGFGVVGGAHRLFTHKSYKATKGLRLAFIILQTLSGQNSVYIWVRDHRLHHKYSDTDADPHNANRGFFFSHMGWLMSYKHPLVKEKGREIDISDLKMDPIVMNQYNYFLIWYLIIAVIIPTSIPIILWGETFKNSIFIAYFLSYTYSLHAAWTVNSFAHIYGNKPFDRFVKPRENKFVSFVTGGEGWHNYHHTFPYDYRTSEFGSRFGLTTSIIDFFARNGWAYDLKIASEEQIIRRMERTGQSS